MLSVDRVISQDSSVFSLLLVTIEDQHLSHWREGTEWVKRATTIVGKVSRSQFTYNRKVCLNVTMIIEPKMWNESIQHFVGQLHDFVLNGHTLLLLLC